VFLHRARNLLVGEQRLLMNGFLGELEPVDARTGFADRAERHGRGAITHHERDGQSPAAMATKAQRMLFMSDAKRATGRFRWRV